MGEHSSEDLKAKVYFNLNIKKSNFSISLAEGKLRITIQRNNKYKSLRISKYGLSYFKHNAHQDFAKLNQENDNLFISKSYATPLSLNPSKRLFMGKENRSFIDAIEAFIDDDNNLALNHLCNAPNSIDASFMLGVIEMFNENYNKALEAFEKVLESPEKLGEVLDKYRIYFKLKMNLTHQQSMPIFFDERCLLICISIIYVELEMNQEAHDLLWDLYLEDKSNSEVVLLLAKLIVESDSYKEAYNEVIYMTCNLTNKRSYDVLLLLYRAQTLKKLGKLKESRNALAFALQRKSCHPLSLVHELMYEQGLVYEELGQKVRARDNFKAINKQNPAFRDVAEKVMLRI